MDAAKNTIIQFRANNDVRSTFESIHEKYGLPTKESTFNMLIEAFQLAEAKKAIPGREKEIEDFVSKLNSISSDFLHLCESCENTEQRVRNEFLVDLQTKDATLQEYQMQLSAAKNAAADLESEAETLRAIAAEVYTVKEALEQAKKTHFVKISRFSEQKIKPLEPIACITLQGSTL